jgi:hypothetical protein
MRELQWNRAVVEQAITNRDERLGPHPAPDEALEAGAIDDEFNRMPPRPFKL